MNINNRAYLILAMLVVLVTPLPAPAYTGPGAGLTLIGSLLALLGAVALGIFGFFWYPIRRILRRRKARQAAETEPPK